MLDKYKTLKHEQCVGDYTNMTGLDKRPKMSRNHWCRGLTWDLSNTDNRQQHTQNVKWIKETRFATQSPHRKYKLEEEKLLFDTEDKKSTC